jgi:cytochrome c oxidase assembly protein subunit 15
MAKVLGSATFLLIVAGGLVTSTESGLSVPDWPTTYGQNMFTFPVSKWVGGIRFEHSHRLIASTVGFLTIVFLAWTFFSHARRWLKTLAVIALLAVVAQGVLGGLTVKYLLPTPISVAHACLAQTFFCLTIALAIATSRWWDRAGERSREETFTRPNAWWSVAAFAALYVQLVLGSWMRHSNAGLAIPDFPASFGGILPDHWDARIAVHFAHRAWAVAAATILVFASVRARSSRLSSGISRLAGLLLALLPIQVLLGALSVWTQKAVLVTVAHQSTGALLLAGTAGLAIALFRLDGASPLPGTPEATRLPVSRLAATEGIA